MTFIIINNQDKRTYGPYDSLDEAKRKAKSFGARNVKWIRFGYFSGDPLISSKNNKWLIIPSSYHRNVLNSSSY